MDIEPGGPAGPPLPDPASLPPELLERVVAFLPLTDARCLSPNRHWRLALFPRGRLPPFLLTRMWDNTEHSAPVLKRVLAGLIEGREWDVLDAGIMVYTMHLQSFGRDFVRRYLDVVSAARLDDARRVKWLCTNARGAFQTYLGFPHAWSRGLARAWVAAGAAGARDSAEYLLESFLPMVREQSGDATHDVLVANAFDQAVANGRTEMVRWLHSRTDILRICREAEAEPIPRRRAPVDVAAAEGDMETVRFLLESGFSLPLDALESAKRGGHMELFHFLAERARVQ
ncbi:hypothetical protein DFJ74DRAFT_763203 [Hyaloraphidium curvatum]|nr:hypothetical protein DFJ74DRAFT_763203 [Hyaloraphidium curvatum]